jgi:hypothetical protein
MTMHTDLCIALYPSANMNGSWVMYNLSAKAYVRSMQWKKLLMMQVVIIIMNECKGHVAITEADLA